MKLAKYREHFESDSSKILVSIIAVLLVGFAVQSTSTSLMSAGGDEALDMDRTQDLTAGHTYDSGAEGDFGDTRDSRSDYEATSVNIRLEIDEVSNSLESLEDLTSEYAGSIERSSIYRGENSDSGRITVKIPKNNHTMFLSDMENFGAVESKSTNTENLEERYTELNLELKNKKQELQKLEELINQSEDVESLIKIQERMSELRSRIQFLENRVSDLDQRIDYVRIDISLDEPEPFTSELDIREVFVDSYEALISSVKTIIVGFGYLLPFAVIWVILRRLRSLVKNIKENEG